MLGIRIVAHRPPTRDLNHFHNVVWKTLELEDSKDKFQFFQEDDMTVAFWCVLIAGVIPYLFVGYAKASPDYLKEGNQTPRNWAQSLPPARLRAYHAHLNGFEAFPPFAAAVIIAFLCKAPQNTVDILALVFIASRVVHGILFIADKSMLRSLVWFVGMACTLGMFVLAANGAQ